MREITAESQGDEGCQKEEQVGHSLCLHEKLRGRGEVISYLENARCQPGTEAHAYHPSIREIEGEELLQVQGHPGLPSQLWASLT